MGMMSPNGIIFDPGSRSPECMLPIPNLDLHIIRERWRLAFLNDSTTFPRLVLFASTST